ncbi:MAG TPA: pyridoxal kinase [Caulobacterales bacterium]|nr:pyridoxal kinase [Caulobacterales bacterium]
MKTILTIQSQVAGAFVGNSVACFVFERLGVRAIALPTVILGRRPDRGPPGGGPTPPAMLASMIDALEADGALAQVDAVLSGYLGGAEQADLVLDAVSRVKAVNPQAFYVCDPVLGDTGGLYVSDEIALAVMQKLVPAGDLIAPNAWELETITGLPVTNLKELRAAVRSLGKPALVTSAPSSSGAAAAYVAGQTAWLAETPRAPSAPKGAGDLFTAVFLAQRLNGRSIAIALEAAAGATYDVIIRSLLRGDGNLAVIEAQDKLAEPDTWPTAQIISD